MATAGLSGPAAAESPLEDAHYRTPHGTQGDLTVYTFWSYTCPICHQMRKDLAGVDQVEWRMIPVGFSGEGWQWTTRKLGLEEAGDNLRLARELNIRGTPTSFIVDGETLYRIQGGRPAEFWEELPARFERMQRRGRTRTGSRE